MIQLHCGDCLEVMGDLAPGSIDLILADLPYGTTACKWDVVIPFEPLWAHYRRLLKPRGAVVLTASQPFTSMLVMSNREWFKYALVWDQKCVSGFLNVKKAPLRSHQDVLVFAATQTTYNPQRVPRSKDELKRLSRAPKQVPVNGRISDCYGEQSFHFFPDRVNNTHKYPPSVITITSREDNGIRGLHPTQKPVALMEYLIRTYSNEGETVLDNTMGSGTTGVACVNTGRDFIGIEKGPEYFAIGSDRLSAAENATPLLRTR